MHQKNQMGVGGMVIEEETAANQVDQLFDMDCGGNGMDTVSA